MSTDQLRELFERAVIERFKESGYLEVEVRVECLGRDGDGYLDGSVDAYWHFWNVGVNAAKDAQPSAPVAFDPALTGADVLRVSMPAFDGIRVLRAEHLPELTMAVSADVFDMLAPRQVTP